MIASYILATHHRPHLLQKCIDRLLRSEVPAGWSLEVVVCANLDDDAGIAVARSYGDPVRLVHDASPRPGGKLTRAFRESIGGLVLVTGDDDLQSPMRLRAAIELHAEKNAKICGLRTYRYVDTTTGQVALWRGTQAAQVGIARSYQRIVLECMGGWKDLPRGIDTDLQNRLAHHNMWYHEIQLPVAIGLDTVCLQHGGNIWQRPFPKKGDTEPRGEFSITGEGHFREVADFPEDVARVL